MTRGLSQFSIAITALGFASAACLADPVSVIDSRRVAIEFQSDDSPVEQAEVWQTRDEGRTWQAAKVERIERSAVIVSAEADGLLGFWLVVRNAAGMSALPPSPGQPPQVTVLVDTQPPTLQLRGARVTWSDGNAGLTLHATLAEENIDASAVRAFARPCGDDAAPWRDLGPILIRAGRASAQLPSELSTMTKLDVCVSATDLAGNRVCERLADVAIPPQPITPPPMAKNEMVGPPAGESPTPTPAKAIHKTDDAPPPDKRDVPVPGAGMTPEEVLRVNELRRTAAEFASRGQWGLAAARFDEAARIAPDLVDVQLDLGQAFMNLNRIDDAVAKFNGVIEKKPDSTTALESLALLTAAQRDYPAARSHLKRLTELQPDSASAWLRYGDIEFKLGNRADAEAAWDRVLELNPADDALSLRAQKRLCDLGEPGRARASTDSSRAGLALKRR